MATSDKKRFFKKFRPSKVHQIGKQTRQTITDKNNDNEIQELDDHWESSIVDGLEDTEQGERERQQGPSHFIGVRTEENGRHPCWP